MFYIRLISILVVLSSIFACSDISTFPETVLRAEQMMDIAPDSARVLLNGFRDSIRTESEATQMYYQLLVVKADDKCYVSHTSDSVMKVVVKYYENCGTSKQLTEAYYYLGSIYRDLGDAPQALHYYQKAVDTSGSGNEYNILGRVYTQMGMLYMYQKVYDEALPVFKRALTSFSLSKDSLALAYVLRDIGRAFTAQNNADSTLYYYEAAYEAAKQINNMECVSTIQSELANIYIQLKYNEQAHSALVQSSAYLEDNGSLAPHYASWGDLYRRTGQQDSAIYYYHKALEIGNVYLEKSVYWNLYQIERTNLHYKEAQEYIDTYLICLDSVQRITDTEAVKKVEMLYNYQHVERENNLLMLANERSKSALYQLLFLIVLLVFIFVGVICYYRRKKQQLIEQERRLRSFEEKRFKESQAQIERNKEQIASLQEELIIVREQNDLVKEELLTIRKKSLEEKNSSIAASCLEREALVALFHHSAIYSLIVGNCKNPEFRMKEVHWIELRKEIDATYDNFTNRLYALYPKLSEKELHVCYLIKLSICASDIAMLVCLKSNSVSSIRKRLYEKIHGVSGTASMMDSFVADF